MALYANLRDYRFSEDVEDIRGSEIIGLEDEKLGTVDDVIFDHASGDMRYLVVDTGGWLSSRKFLVPARQVMTATEGEERNYRVALRKDQIERFPEYREEAIDRDDEFTDYERRYDDAYKLSSTGDVLHREGTTNIITPAPSEMPAGGGTATSSADVTPRRIAQDMPRFGANSDSESSTHAGNLAGDDRPLQPSSTLRPGDVSRDPGFTGGNESNEEIHRTAERMKTNDAGLRAGAEHVTLDRDEFLKDGTLRSEYDAPREDTFLENESQHRVGAAGEVSGNEPDGGRRFRAFQERLRREREEIIRRRNERKAA